MNRFGKFGPEAPGRALLESAALALITVPTVYLAFSLGLGGSLLLSPANADYGIRQGVMIGLGCMLVVWPFRMRYRSTTIRGDLLMVLLAEVLIFAGVYLFTAAIASC